METMIFGVPMASVLAMVGLSFLGYAAHVMLKVVDLRESDPTMTLWRYLSTYPYLTILKLAAVTGIAVGLAETDITKVVAAGAVTIGYTADSALDKLRNLGA